MRLKVTLIILIILAGGAFWFWSTNAQTQDPTTENQEEVLPPEPVYNKQSEEIVSGDTFSEVIERAEVADETHLHIIRAVNEVYNAAEIVAGKSFDFYTDPETEELVKMVYQINTVTELVAKKTDAGWTAKVVDIDYDVRVTTVEGTVTTSLYGAALAQGIDVRAIITLAEVFQWTVDFAMDVRAGDSFTFIYEERYRNGEYVMPGKILAAKYVNANTPYYAFYFKESGETSGYFDERADSVQRIFLKAPVAYKYISSGFTTGSRYVKAFNVSTGHRAIDYAAPMGTPIRVVGDGTVTFAGWNGSYGNFITVRHNETYSTNYAHLSRINISRGQKVSQGDTIGLVGSTGFSTGPHLHYEMVKFGTKINPLAEEFPSSEAIAEENRERYFNEIKDLATGLRIEL